MNSNNLFFSSSSEGYGFRPSDEELIGHLRNRTLVGRDYSVPHITDLGLDICNWDPWDLPDLAMVAPSETEWYFFYPITYKNPNSKGKGKGKGKQKPINRSTPEGLWKLSGNPRMVRAPDTKTQIIGIKRGLYFYLGRGGGGRGANNNNDNNNNNKPKTKHQNCYLTKTPWVLHQYALANDNLEHEPNQSQLFLGKLMKLCEPTNVLPSSQGQGQGQGQRLNSLGNHVPGPESPEVQHESSLVEMISMSQVQHVSLVDMMMQVSNYNLFIQNQSSIVQQPNHFLTSLPPLVDSETYSQPQERNNQHIEVSGLRSDCALGNCGADNAIPPNLQANHMEQMTELEVGNLHVGAQYQLNPNQHVHSSQNVAIINEDEACSEVGSNQPNAISGTYDFSNNHNHSAVEDISLMNWSQFDDSYWDGLYLDELIGVLEAPNSYIGVQNQSTTNHPDESSNSNSVAVAVEIEGSNSADSA